MSEEKKKIENKEKEEKKETVVQPLNEKSPSNSFVPKSDDEMINPTPLRPGVKLPEVESLKDSPKPLNPSNDKPKVRVPEVRNATVVTPAPIKVEGTKGQGGDTTQGDGEGSEENEKRLTIADMLAPRREALKKDKTDSVKMQKYYALTDALQALGKMGGAAIGGAIGGNMLDSAPDVGEYKPSRGYLDAIEKSKEANERLRSLDEEEFQLALRDEERSYKQQENKLNREWQKKMVDYNNQIERANAKEDFERSRKLKEELAEKEQKYQKEILELRNKYNQADKAASRNNIKYQYDIYNKPIPIAFDDGTGIEVSEDDYKGLFNYLNGKTIGGRVVNKDNLSVVLRENPKLVTDYLKVFGRETSATTNTTQQGAESGVKQDNADNYGYHYNPILGKSVRNFIPNMPNIWNQGDSTINKNSSSEKTDKKEGAYSVADDPFASFLEE